MSLGNKAWSGPASRFNDRGERDSARDVKPGPTLASPAHKAAFVAWIEANYNGGWAALVPLPDVCERLAQCAETLPSGIAGRLRLGSAVTYRSAIARLRAELAALEWLSGGAARAIADGRLVGELDTMRNWQSIVPASVCTGLGMSGTASFAAVAAFVRERILANQARPAEPDPFAAHGPSGPTAERVRRSGI